MTQLDRFNLRPQGTTSNRPESPFVPLVGESAVRLAHVGLAPVRIDGLPTTQSMDGGRLVRARRDRVGRIGEFRAFVVEEDAFDVVSVAFVPRPSLDLGVFGTEIAQTASGVTGAFGIYAGSGTWFAGQHAHHAYQEIRRAAPDLVPDEGQRSARARQRGFTFQVRVERDEIGRLEDLHRRLWGAYVRSLHDALELDVEGAERNARAIEAWKSHRRSVGLVARVLNDAGAPEATKLHADVLTL
ncbi:MAG: hypothetical protein H6733_14950 [Alphaproteobacteria bacterium]|nr:hypothetical protein [Alphaproteobacteria bacterium]